MTSDGSEPRAVRTTGTRSSKPRMFRSLENRNYRRYVLAHGLSTVGLWLQQTAEIWLILELTGSGTAVGMHPVLRLGPLLLVGTFSGLLTDRVDRRRLLIATQFCHTVSVSVMAAIAWIGRPNLTLVYAVVLAQGLVNAIDNPLRRTFIRDLVTDDDLANAVSLHSSVGTVTRVVGPAIGGLLIAYTGVAWCFTLNALSYIAVLAVLATLRREELRAQVFAPRLPGFIREGISYAWRTPAIKDSLLLVMVAGIFAWNWTVLLPFYATEELGGGATLFGGLASLLGVGAFCGALLMARVEPVRRRHLLTAGGALSAALFLTALAPTLLVAGAALVLLGGTSTAVVVSSQARIQVILQDQMSGRVLALYSVAFAGSKPIGGLLGGWVTELSSSRLAFATGAAVIGAVSLGLGWRGRLPAVEREKAEQVHSETSSTMPTANEP